MSVKKIQFNAEAFQAKQKKPKSIKSSMIINQNSLKTKLLNRIKQSKNKKEVNIQLKPDIINGTSTSAPVVDEFLSSMDYLSNIAKTPPVSPDHSPTTTTTTPPIQIPVEIQEDVEELSSTSPPLTYTIGRYDDKPGCLKNGLKQTYRQFTRKNACFVEEVPSPPPLLPKPTTKILKRTTHRKVTLGKIGNKISVLIKNSDTRKKIKNAHNDLKCAPISEVKEYLKKHFLLKSGSNAPSDILRNMYESAKLAGEITNKNEETLLHNFINN